MQLSDSTYSAIRALCQQGDDLAKTGDLEAAKQSYLAALRLLPANHQEWEAATWIYVAIGDVHYRMNNYDKAFKCFYNAVQSPKGLGNPYFIFGWGSCITNRKALKRQPTS